MENDNFKILGIIFLCEFAIIFLVFLLFVGLFLFNSAMILFNTNSSSSFTSVFVIYAVILFVYTIFMTPFGLAGWKLFSNKAGARFWGVIASVFSLVFFFPFGLIISILGFVILFSNNEAANRAYSGARQQNFYPSPPQQNW